MFLGASVFDLFLKNSEGAKTIYINFCSTGAASDELSNEYTLGAERARKSVSADFS